MSHMEKKDIDKIKGRLIKVISFLDPAFIKALLSLHRTFENVHVEWAVGGELAEALETIQVEPTASRLSQAKKEQNKSSQRQKNIVLKHWTIQTTQTFEKCKH